MPDYRTQPESPEAEQRLDVGQQLDALLNAIEQTEPGLMTGAGALKGRPRPMDSSSPIEQPDCNPAAEAAVPHADAAPKPGENDGPVDRLNDQLTALLREARSLQTDASAPASEELADVDEGATADSSAGFTATPPGPASPREMAAAATADGDDDAATREVIHQIDELLASGADEAVDDVFETPTDVLGDEQIPPTQAAAVMGDADGLTAGFESGADDDEASATAAAIGRELDEQPEEAAFELETAATTGDTDADAANVAAVPVAHTTHAADAQPQPGFAEAAAALGDAPPLAPAGTARWLLWQNRLYRVCVAVNRPLQRASADVRRGVGYVALLMLFNGVVLTLFGLIRVVTG